MAEKSIAFPSEEEPRVGDIESWPETVKKTGLTQTSKEKCIEFAGRSADKTLLVAWNPNKMLRGKDGKRQS